MSIKKTNKLIADFLELSKCDRCKDCGKYKIGPSLFYSPEEMKYHNSWDWLMPVVVKITSVYMTNYYSEFDMSCPEAYVVCIGDDGKYRSDGESKESLLNATYNAVIGFINWVNNNP